MRAGLSPPRLHVAGVVYFTIAFSARCLVHDDFTACEVAISRMVIAPRHRLHEDETYKWAAIID